MTDLNPKDVCVRSTLAAATSDTLLASQGETWPIPLSHLHQVGSFTRSTSFTPLLTQLGSRRAGGGISLFVWIGESRNSTLANSSADATRLFSHPYMTQLMSTGTVCQICDPLKLRLRTRPKHPLSSRWSLPFSCQLYCARTSSICVSSYLFFALVAIHRRLGYVYLTGQPDGARNV